MKQPMRKLDGEVKFGVQCSKCGATENWNVAVEKEWMEVKDVKGERATFEFECIKCSGGGIGDTRMLEGHVPKGVRVQIPLRTPDVLQQNCFTTKVLQNCPKKWV